MAEIIQVDMRQIGMDVSSGGEKASCIYARHRASRFCMIFHRAWGVPSALQAFISSMRVSSLVDFQTQ